MKSGFAEVAGRIQLVIAAGIVVAAALAWPGAPERVAVDWNAYGEVERWASRTEGLLVLPAVVVLLSVLQRVLPRLDPGRANYSNFAAAWAGSWLAATVVMAGMYAARLAVINGHEMDMSRVKTLLVSTLFVVLGGFMGKLRPNWFAGVRTPWTLSSKTAWIRTHRLAGWMFVATGVIGWIATLLSPTVAAYVLPGCAVTTAVVCTIYSYFVWRDAPDKIPPAGTSPAD